MKNSRQISAAVGRWWGIAALVGLAAVAIYLARDIPNYPATQVEAYRNRPEIAAALAATEPKDRLAAESNLLQYQTDNQIKIWTGIVQAVGAVVLAVGGYFTYRNLGVAQEGQITNRFTQAIGQLGAELKDGKPNLEVRLGGIYALERIARDSPRDHWTIMEVLTAYVHENAPWPRRADARPSISPWRARQGANATAGIKPPRTDIQAVLTVLGRRRIPSPEWPELSRLDLSAIDLRRANLTGANLTGADFSEAILSGAILSGANLRRANLSGADFSGANLRRANLTGANLTRADFSKAILSGADFSGAILSWANLSGADFSEAILSGANLFGADFREAKNLHAEQVKSARIQTGAVFSPEIAAELYGPGTESAPPPSSASPIS